MEKHCVSLELAKPLKECGWKKETEFWWFEDRRFVRFDSKKWKDEFSKDWGLINHKITDECIPAPLATEILEELPNSIGRGYLLTITKGNGCYGINYGDNYYTEDKSLPNALAKMWLYLKKEKLI